MGNLNKLKQLLDNKAREREFYENKEKEARAREKEIEEAKEFKLTDFWCDECREDFVNMGYKEVVHYEDVNVAKYESKCPYCRGKVIRYITDRLLDPYWNKSEKVRVDRGAAEIDMLQPSDPRFRLYYPRQWAEMEKQKEQAEFNKKYAKIE